uniref:Uncharacterized protein n=1 Tax=Ciona intestinalis TaxID=7719 RepID=H2XKL3_CIOIN
MFIVFIKSNMLKIFQTYSPILSTARLMKVKCSCKVVSHGKCMLICFV